MNETDKKVLLSLIRSILKEEKGQSENIVKVIFDSITNELYTIDGTGTKTSILFLPTNKGDWEEGLDVYQYDKYNYLDCEFQANETGLTSAPGYIDYSDEYPEGKVVANEGWSIIMNNKDTELLINLNSKIISEAFAYLNAEIEGLKEDLKKYEASIYCNSVDALYYYEEKAPKVLFSSIQGAPSEANIPDNWDESISGIWNGAPRFMGQIYISVGNSKVYIAKALTNSTGDWVVLN